MTKRQPRYKIGDIIGGQFRVYEVHMGGMGEVYLCLDRNKIPVALKTFQGADTRMKQLFEEETRTWIELGKHPNIVRCHWMNIHNNTPFMGLEWIFGEEGYGADLRSWVRKGALDLKQSLKFAIDIVRGLVYANKKSAGIVHRDLKPDNVLVAEGGMAKITDFGLATIIQKSDMELPKEDEIDVESSHQSIRHGNIVGTPAYMPPEQWRGDMDIDPRADIYAVGCILYEMLTGRIPYMANTINQLRLQHQETPIPQVKHVPAEVNTIISKCMAKNWDERYPTAQALLDVLMVAYQAHTGETLPDVQAGEMTATDYLNRGLTYHNLGEYTLAIDSYDTSIRLNPIYAEAYNNRGASYGTLKQHEQAIADFDIAIRLNPTLALPYLSRGISYGDIGQYERAIADYDTAIRLNPAFADAYKNRGIRYGTLGQHKQAIVDFDIAIGIKPNDADAYYNRGISYQALGQHERGIADYDIAIRLNPNFTDAFINRGNSYHALEQYERAIANYDIAIRLNQTNIDTFINRGNSYVALGQHERAIADYDIAIRLNPTNIDTFINRGNSYVALGQHERAIADCNEIIRLNPTFALAYYNRGNSYGAIGQYERAITDYDTAIRLNPSYAESWFNKGTIYANTGQFQEALTCLERAYQLGLTQVIGVIQQVKQLMIVPPQNNPQVAFGAFQRSTSLDEMRQAVAQYPMLKGMVQTIQQVIQTQLPPNLKPEFETRLAWLIQIAKGE
jgi:tetratricopeptide (TPR) repeat protein